MNTFERDGFFYDGGIRAMENSGVLFPMLKHLGLDIDFVENHISIGIEDQVIRINSEENVAEYQALLAEFVPRESQPRSTRSSPRSRRSCTTWTSSTASTIPSFWI